jgi:para-aminobenzoate synthetase component 1
VSNHKKPFPVQTVPDLNSVLESMRHESIAMVLISAADPENSFDWLAALGKKDAIIPEKSEKPFDELQDFVGKKKEWKFGHFSYDLKNSIEKLKSAHEDGVQFPLMTFFVPRTLLINSGGQTRYELYDETAEKKPGSDREIHSEIVPEKIKINQRTTREKYLVNVNSLLKHVHRGDIYEINYCIEFFAEHVTIDPVETFKKLNQLTEAPYSALYKNGDQWLICASPERFLQKKGTRIISQPIKGTRARGKNEEEDKRQKNELRNDPKERSENVMIVDLVRNDLSRSAKKGSVKVDELFGIYSFKNVHQMISTVSAELDASVHPVDAIKNAFPMGSMTGAPKVRAMELAEEIETMKRGLYSGAVGYFTPEMDFDFNVVIRSIQYNPKTGYLSLMVGSAITAAADPEKEYEECLVKAETLFKALGVELKD